MTDQFHPDNIVVPFANSTTPFDLTVLTDDLSSPSPSENPGLAPHEDEDMNVDGEDDEDDEDDDENEDETREMIRKEKMMKESEKKRKRDDEVYEKRMREMEKKKAKYEAMAEESKARMAAALVEVDMLRTSLREKQAHLESLRA
ncbi:hypothetical protein IAT38_005285 [Cryptococcus sp. DSM 104549]